MAIDALCAELLVFHHVAVAHVTIERGVGSQQREFESLQMVKARDSPDIAVVAVRALRPQPAHMFVIRLVATDAILRDRVLQIAAAVAVATADPCVFAIQGETGLAGMVKPLGGPVRRRMTVGTLRTLAALVHIIGHVAAHTLLRCALVVLARMARSARNFAMLVGKRESGPFVIERVLLPRPRLMTALAVAAQATPMDVVLAVAIDAGGRCFAIGRVSAMAAAARYRYVRVLQREARQIMCEARLTEFVDIGATAQMLGVAAPTLARGRLGHASVIAGPGADIRGDFLVTVQAEGGLALPVGAIMAVAAFTFDPGMGL